MRIEKDVRRRKRSTRERENENRKVGKGISEKES